MGFGSKRLRIDRDMAEEIEFHVEMRSKELVAEGASPEEARREALARFGDPDAVERRLRRLRTGGPFRRVKIVVVVVLALLLAFVAGVVVTGNTRRALYTVTDEFPKRAPYRAVRWSGETPEVKLDDEWFRLEAVDGLSTERIVANCRARWPDIWKKRFEEDLVRVLYGMGHAPGRLVSLELVDLVEGKPVPLAGVEMTEANRWEIWFAANRGELR